MPSDLTKRIIAGLVVAAISMAAIVFNGWAFVTFIVASVLLLSWEWIGLKCQSIRRRRQTIILAATIMLIVVAALAMVGRPFIAWLTIIDVVLIIALLGLLYRTEICAEPSERRWIWTGLLWICIPAIALVGLRRQPDGLDLVIWLVLVVIATDTFAYFVGNAFKGPKLAPTISPGKTWSGFFGGVLGAMLVGGLASSMLSQSIIHVLIVASLLAVVAQGGDLLESAVKRRAGVKDSGKLIPGHGGIFDRLDGYLAATPVFYCLHLVDRL